MLYEVITVPTIGQSHVQAFYQLVIYLRLEAGGIGRSIEVIKINSLWILIQIRYYLIPEIGAIQIEADGTTAIGQAEFLREICPQVPSHLGLQSVGGSRGIAQNDDLAR